MMVMMTWSNIAKSGNAPLSSSCVNIDLGRFQIKREKDIYGPTKIKINYTEFKVILTILPFKLQRLKQRQFHLRSLDKNELKVADFL